MTILTYRYRIKDSTAGKHLLRMSSAVNKVWNFCNEVTLLAWRRDKRLLTQYDLQKLTAGVAQDLGLASETIQEICREYAQKRQQFHRIKLKWRSRKRSLPWIPLRGDGFRIVGDTVIYRRKRYRLWLSRPVAGTIKTGSFTQDARGHWYVNLACDVPALHGPPGPQEVGIDLGLTDQIACTHLPEPLSRANITKHYALKLAMAQRANKAKRVKALHAKIANTRKDWTHKATTAIASQARLIAVGNVSSTKLAKTPFAKSTYDAGWGITRALLRYKAERLGAHYVEVSEFRSSCTCAVCGSLTGPRGLRQLGVKVWTCSVCGTRHHRDINSAHIHLRLGRQTLFQESQRLERWEDVNRAGW